ncbi:hypothetical protein TcBrA4_0042960 [Trypanosoma cruzi]|nr:hypothetical protein TcBrA4_0042960 [Trypanosoma cruzi]
MPRGGRHAGGADTAPNGIQGQPTNSPDYYYFGNCGVTTVVHRLWAAPSLVRVDVWIDDIRIAGSKSDVALWETQVLFNADSCHASLGEDREPGATQCTFLGVQFDHTHRAVSLSDGFVRFVCAMPALNSSTIAEMEVMASRFLYAAAILCTRSCDYYFLTTAVRRRLSALNRGIVLETSPANLPPSAVGLGERLRHIIENNRSRMFKPTEKASAAIMDASLHGWRAVFIPDSGDVKIAGGKWEEEAFSYHAGRGARYAQPYRPFPPSCHPPWTFGRTTLRCKELRIKAAQNRTP